MQRSGHSAAMMSAVRAPQSKPPMVAFSILRASIKAMTSTAIDRLLAVAERVAGKKARRAIAAQIRDDHPVARRRQQRGDIDKAVNVVGPAVQKNDRGTIGGTGFGVSDIEEAGVDLLQRAKRRVRSRLDRAQLRRFCSRCRGTDHAELGGSKGHRRSAKKAAAMLVDLFGRFGLIHGEAPEFDGWSASTTSTRSGWRRETARTTCAVFHFSSICARILSPRERPWNRIAAAPTPRSGRLWEACAVGFQKHAPSN